MWSRNALENLNPRINQLVAEHFGSCQKNRLVLNLFFAFRCDFVGAVINRADNCLLPSVAERKREIESISFFRRLHAAARIYHIKSFKSHTHRMRPNKTSRYNRTLAAVIITRALRSGSGTAGRLPVFGWARDCCVLGLLEVEVGLEQMS